MLPIFAWCYRASEATGTCSCAWAQASTHLGISPDELEKIFQPFFSTKLAKGGTGLGLSISFNIVKRHGGEIRVVSTPGEGSRFIVELPRYHPTDEGAA